MLVEITDDGRAVASKMLAGIRVLERSMLSSLSERERMQLVRLLGKVLDRAAEIATEPPSELDGRRFLPSRLG